MIRAWGIADYPSSHQLTLLDKEWGLIQDMPRLMRAKNRRILDNRACSRSDEGFDYNDLARSVEQLVNKVGTLNVTVNEVKNKHDQLENEEM